MPKLRPATRVLGPPAIGLLPGIVRFFRDRDASLAGKAFVLLSIAYVIFPADLIPDVIPVLGWLDDLGVVGFALAYLHRVSARYRFDREP